jgi:hypothetical protein
VYPDHGGSFLEAATTECHASNPLKYIYFSAPASAFPHPIDSTANTATTTTTPPLRQTYYVENPWRLTYAPFHAHSPLTLLAHPHLPSLCGWRPLAGVSGAGVRRGVIVIVIVIGLEVGGWVGG